MKKIVFAFVAVAAITLTGMSTSTAHAGDFAIHVAGPGYHFDIGDRHGHHRGPRSHRSFHRGHGHRGRPVGYFGGHRLHGGHVWHDTSHWDYHPGRLVPHYDHYDYVPGHYHYHREGHFDYLGW